MRALLRLFGVLLLGVVVGVAGTVMHRSSHPWGLVLALGLVLTVTVLARAAAGRAAVLLEWAALLLVLAGLSQYGPGGDVLIPGGDDHWGWYWLGGACAVVLAVLALPASWFADLPLRRRTAP